MAPATIRSYRIHRPRPGTSSMRTARTLKGGGPVPRAAVRSTWTQCSGFTPTDDLRRGSEHLIHLDRIPPHHSLSFPAGERHHDRLR